MNERSYIVSALIVLRRRRKLQALSQQQVLSYQDPEKKPNAKNDKKLP